MTRINRRFYSPMLIGLFFLLLMGLASAATNADAQIREYVQVNQIELIVRVFDSKGKPVTGLTKEDFSIMESGNPTEVTSCLEVNRKISEKKNSGQISPPRLFLVYFWVWQESESYQHYLDYLFDHIYRDGDTVILSQPSDTRVIQRRAEIAEVRRQFERDLQKWTRQQSQNMVNVVETFQSILEDFISNERLLTSQPNNGAFKRAFAVFKASLLSEWRAFRSSFLDIPNRNFQHLANLLSSIKHQKWAIVFLQPATFPAIQPNALIWTRFSHHQQAEILRDFATDMIRRMNTPHESAMQILAIEQAFIRANATFHILRMDTRRDETDGHPDLVMREVFSDRQLTFQRLSKVTGGRIISDNIPERGMRRLSDAEDIYYRLTYHPIRKSGNQTSDRRRLTISVPQHEYRVHHVRRIRLSEVEEIRLAEFHCDSTRLKFILTGYAVRMDQERLQSDVTIHISAESPRGEEMSFSRHFDTQEPFLEVSLALNFPHSGSYRLRFKAEDRFTGMSITESQVIQVILTEKTEKPSSGENQP